MPSFSQKSLARLGTCHPDLQRLFFAVIERVDCSVITGHRDEEDQDQAVASGASKAPWPTSKHNRLPSMAVDVIPYPLKSWKDLPAFRALAAVVNEEAKRLGVKVRWGADWNMNGRSDDEKFLDHPHWELVP